jgi:glycosyltransferase involved in cell wall biosynthesis
MESSSIVKNVTNRRAISPRLRVLIVAPSLDILGGQSRQAARLMEALKQEQTIEIGFVPHNPAAARPFRWLQKIKYLRTIVTSVLYWSMLLMRVRHYDIIHIFSASYYSYLLSVAPAMVIGKLFGKKVILNYRSGEAEDHLSRWRLTAVPTMRLADIIVVPSGYLVDVFAKFGQRAQSIFNIVELDRFRFRERRPLRPVFLASRLLEPLYNVGCVLRAFALIQQKFPNATLTIAGEGWMRAELEELAETLGLRNVTFAGRVAFENMPDLYDSADIYLNGTNIDNMPSSLTECFASGLPVITTNAGGIPYIIKHEVSGLMVNCNDHRAMAESAVRLLEDDGALAARLSRNAYQTCRQYTWPAVRDQWLNLYFTLREEKSLPESYTTEREAVSNH